MIKLVLPLKPVPKGRPRATRSGRVYTPKTTATFESDIKHLTAHLTPIAGAISVDAIFVLPRPKRTKKAITSRFIKPSSRGDVDNYLKSLLDGLEGNAFNNDSQVVRLSGLKCYSAPDESPHIEVVIAEVTDLDCVPMTKEQRRAKNRIEHRLYQEERNARVRAERKAKKAKRSDEQKGWRHQQAVKIANVLEKLGKHR